MNVPRHPVRPHALMVALSFLSMMAISAQAASDVAPFDRPQLERDTMVAIRDNVKLATDIYRPTRNGQPVTEPLPVILHRIRVDISSSNFPCFDVNPNT